MIRLMLLTVLISANCIDTNCDEETSAITDANESSEKSESLYSNDGSVPTQFKAGSIETENEESKTVDGEEIRVYRSSSDRSAKTEAHFDNSSKVDRKEDSLAETSASNKSIPEIYRQADIETNEPEGKTDIVEISHDETKSVKNEQSKELPETSRTTPENEEKRTEDIAEASAESKVSDNEKTSFKVDETDRNFESGEIKEKSDMSGLSESSGIRKMLSDPENIIIDIKARTDTTSNPVVPEVKTALNKSLNTYNILNEFGSNSNINLIDSPRTESAPLAVKTTIPVVTNAADPEILNRQYIPKPHSRPKLNKNILNVNSDFKQSRDLPIHLKLNQDNIQVKDQFPEMKNLQFKFKENTHNNLRNQQQYPQSQEMLGTPANKQFQEAQTETKNQMTRFYDNKVQTNFENFIRNRQIANLNQDARYQVQQLHQNKNGINSDYKQHGNVRHVSGSEVQAMMNSKMPINNEQRNQYPLFRQPQEMINSGIFSYNRQFENEHYTKLYPYLHSPNPQQFNTMNFLLGYNNNIIPKQIQFLFQHLARASQFPIFLYNNNNIVQHLPYFMNFRAGSSFYMPGYHQLI